MASAQPVPPLRHADDADLVARLRTGDAEALAGLYRRHARKLHVFFATTLSVREPDDMVHDVFVRVIEAAGQFDSRRAPFRAWLFRIARNRATDVHRRGQRIGFSPLGPTDDPPADADRQVERDDLDAAVRACLGALDSDDERQVFVMYYLSDKVLREVAEAIGKSIGTARNWIESARAKMRDCLEGKGFAP